MTTKKTATQSYRELLDRLEDNREIITKLFLESKQRVDAKAGFIGFENADGQIAIFKSDGANYYHADKKDGFTGFVFNRGESAIFDPRNRDHGKQIITTERAMEEDPDFSEMVSVIKHNDSVVGVILLDKYSRPKFKESDLVMLNGVCNQISEILGDHEPWPFRSWWERHEHNMREQLFRRVGEKLRPILKDHSQDSADIAVVSGGNIVPDRIINVEGSRNRGIDDVERDVLLSGRAEMKPNMEFKGKVCVPIPSTGPIIGIVTTYVETHGNQGSKGKLEELKDAMVKCLDSVEFGYFDQLFEKSDVAGLFISLLMNSLRTRTNFFQKIDRVRTDIRKLVEEDFSILLSRDIWIHTPNTHGSNWEIVPQTVLEQEYSKNNRTSNRPKYWIDRNDDESRLLCPIWVGTRLLGGIRSSPRPIEMGNVSSLSYEFDGPVVEVLSTIFSRIIAEEIKRDAKINFLKICTQSRSITKLHAQLGLRMLNCFYFCIAVQSSNKEMTIEMATEESDESTEQHIRRLGEALCNHEGLGDEVNVVTENELSSEIWSDAKSLFDQLETKNAIVRQILQGDKRVTVFCILKREGSFRIGFTPDDVLNMETFVQLTRLVV